MVWKILFDDKESVKQKTGDIIYIRDSFVYLNVEGTTHAIPIHSVVRMEESE